jgi:glycosyltransferase involved in cell wall biosynthesis
LVDPPEISLVVPVYNEEALVAPFIQAVTPHLDAASRSWEIVFVSDGSQDGTFANIRAANAADNRIRGVNLSRNFGKEIALAAGLQHAGGQAVIPMDVDLQDPPEVAPLLVARWREGFDVVLARRSDRSSDAPAKRITAGMFYWLIRRISRVDIPRDVGDFRLLDRRVVDVLNQFPERERFMKGIFASVGFRTAVVEFARPARFDGQSKFGPRKLINLAVEGAVSFSTAPLKIWTYIGFLVAIFGLIYMIYYLLRTLIFGIDVPGYASLLSITLFMNGMMLIGLGVQGEYIARIFTEVKARPLYIVADRIGLPPAHRRTD